MTFFGHCGTRGHCDHWWTRGEGVGGWAAAGVVGLRAGGPVGLEAAVDLGQGWAALG